MKRISILILVFSLFIACNSDEGYTKQPHKQARMIEDSLMKANKFLLERDSELIQSYVNRHKWNMKISSGGIWYDIYERSGLSLPKGGWHLM